MKEGCNKDGVKSNFSSWDIYFHYYVKIWKKSQI